MTPKKPNSKSLETNVADPDPVLFYPRIRDEFFPDPGSKEYVFGEIFLRILVL
jgi:hypothetical protein